MPKFNDKRSKKTARRRGRRGAKRQAKPSKTFANKVKQVLHKQVESKQAFLTSGNTLVNFNSGINTTADMLQIIPNITQGTADNNRIGDQIRSQSISLKGYIRLSPNTSFNSSTLPAVVARLFIVSLKTKPNYTEAVSTATALGGLLKKGGTTSGFGGNLQDIYSPVNTDLWTVHADRKFYLNQSFLLQPPTLGALSVPVDVKNTIKFFNLNVRCKNKLLKYDANISSALLPTNYGPIMLLGYAYLDGSSPDVVSTNLGLQYDVIFNYEDA